MSKTAQKQERYKKLDPPVTVDVVHNHTKERRQITFTLRNRDKVEGTWPGCGFVVFNRDTGQGYNETKLWHIPAEGLRALRGDEDYRPKPPKVTPTGRAPTVKKTKGTAQTELVFDGSISAAAPSPAPQVEPISRIAPPRRIEPSMADFAPFILSKEEYKRAMQFRRASHAQLTSYKPPPPAEDDL